MKKTNEDAVSPVVGVMLMLVVTIIIAAVVSAFSGGIVETTEKAPSASMDVDFNLAADDSMGNLVPRMVFKHLGGDPIDTGDIQIITYYTNSSGYVYKHVQSKTSDATVTSSSGSDYRVPYYADMTTGYASSNPDTKDFGNFTLMSGDLMTTGALRGTAELLGMAWSDGATTSTRDDEFVDDSLHTGSVVEIKILHIPSGQYIFDKKVVAK